MVRYALVVALVLSSTTVVHADDGIALEVYVGQRPNDASRLVQPVLDELSHAKITSGEQLGHQFDDRMSIPSRTEKGLPGDFAAQAEAALRVYASGRFTDAINAIGPLIEAAHQNSAVFTKEPRLRDSLAKALTVLALSHRGNGDLGTMRVTFDELVRSFPDITVPSSTYGPDALRAFEESRKALATRGTAKLMIKVQTGVVFINETYRGTGSLTIEVPEGDYRVVVIANDKPSRTHLASVRGGTEATVEIDAALDQALHTTGWTGFLFDTPAERAKFEAAYAATLAKAIKAKSVSIVGIEKEGKPQIVGKLISLDTGAPLRGASVSLDPDPARSTLKSLANYLLGIESTVGPGVDVINLRALPAPDSIRIPIRDAGRQVDSTYTVESRWGGYRWFALGATLALGGTGGVLYALNGHCKTEPPQGRTCTDIYQNSPYDKVALLAAIPFAAATIYLFATQTKSVEYRTAFLAPTKNGAIAGYAFTW